MKAFFFNTSLQPLKTVARIALPPSFNADSYSYTTSYGEIFRLSKFFSIGDTSIIFTTKGTFPPGKIEGEVSSNQSTSSPFAMSDWVSKNPIGSILIAVITLANGQVIRLPFGNKSSLQKLNQDQLVFEVMSDVISGFKSTQYLTVNSGVDHVEFKFGLNWADRADPTYAKEVLKIEIESKDKFVIHFQQGMGIGQPVYIPQIDTWKLLIHGNATLRDGQGFEVRGYILTNPELITNLTPEIQARLTNLAAVENGIQRTGGLGEVVGSCENINATNSWFYGYLPPKINIDLPWKNPFYTESIYSARSIGMATTPFQTGGQEDFGADKGQEVTVYNNPEWLTYIKGGLTDRMRFFNIHEPNGSPVYKALHPNRITWDMQTFDALSQDLLGKVRYAFRPPGNGWYGYDNQHRSQNNLLTYYALTGDELVLNTLVNCVEADLQQARNLGLADREIGRMFACWAKYIKVLPAAYGDIVKSHALMKFREIETDWRGRFPNVGPVKALQVIQDPRTGIVNPVSNRLELATAPYQTAELVKGLYAFWLATGDASVLEMCKQFANTVLWYGCFKENNVWHNLVFLRYMTGLPSGQLLSPLTASDGEGQPISNYSTTSWELHIGSWGLWDWLAPAIGIAREILSQPESKDRATEILNSVYPNGLSNMEESSWFCTRL